MFVIKSVAVMVVLPALTRVSKHCEPVAMLICATAGSDDSQKTNVVRSSSVPSANVSLAVNCCCDVVAREMTALGALTTIDNALLSETVVDPEKLFVKSVAVMVAVPTPSDETKP